MWLLLPIWLGLVAVWVAYALGRISADTALVSISVIAAVITSLAIAQSSKASRLDRQPSLAVGTRRDKERHVPNYYLVHVRNSGPGVARKVAVALNYERPTQGEKLVEDSVDSLPVDGTLDLPREAPCTARGRSRICGTMTCKDANDLSYWWYRAGAEDEWQSGTGSLPKEASEGVSWRG
jgi:hypothetical protein